MLQSWPEIERFYEELEVAADDGEFRFAVRAIGQIANRIARGDFGASLFGWTSMHDLCVQQTNIAPFAGSFLRISPKFEAVEFRLMDTEIQSRQWSRLVPPTEAISTFKTFFEDLRWN